MGIILLIIGLVLFSLIAYLFFGKAPIQKDIVWGVNFSQMQAEQLGLDWKEVYSSMIYDLKARDVKILVNWDWINGTEDNYFFDDLDWQVDRAEQAGVNLILSIGMKTGRWPECHIPTWARSLSKENREAAILKYLTHLVQRYENSNSIKYWQVENEPFFPFGECPKTDINFVKEEVALVKALDGKKRPIIVSDTGEFSLWLKPASIGDIVGTTMYRSFWVHELRIYSSPPFPPLAYYLRAKLIGAIYKKDVWCVELQAEPWGPKLLYDLPLSEQTKTMDLEKFKKNVKFAKETGWKDFYLWGVEWWYWMKEAQGQPEIWQEAKTLFQN